MKKITLASLAALACCAFSCQQGAKESENKKSPAEMEQKEQPVEGQNVQKTGNEQPLPLKPKKSY